MVRLRGTASYSTLEPEYLLAARVCVHIVLAIIGLCHVIEERARPP
jgi:hypothetical protein